MRQGGEGEEEGGDRRDSEEAERQGQEGRFRLRHSVDNSLYLLSGGDHAGQAEQHGACLVSNIFHIFFKHAISCIFAC